MESPRYTWMVERHATRFSKSSISLEAGATDLLRRLILAFHDVDGIGSALGCSFLTTSFVDNFAVLQMEYCILSRG